MAGPDLELVTAYAAPTTNAAELLGLTGHPVGGLRLPLVEADAGELEQIRAVLERNGLLTGAGA